MCGGGGGGGGGVGGTEGFLKGGRGRILKEFIPLDMISGRREGGGGGGCRILNYLPFLPPTTLLNGTAPREKTQNVRIYDSTVTSEKVQET